MKNVGCFNTDDCGALNGGHYGTDGILETGKRYAAEYKRIEGL